MDQAPEAWLDIEALKLPFVRRSDVATNLPSRPFVQDRVAPFMKLVTLEPGSSRVNSSAVSSTPPLALISLSLSSCARAGCDKAQSAIIASRVVMQIVFTVHLRMDERQRTQLPKLIEIYAGTFEPGLEGSSHSQAGDTRGLA